MLSINSPEPLAVLTKESEEKRHQITEPLLTQQIITTNEAAIINESNDEYQILGTSYFWLTIFIFFFILKIKFLV